MYAVWHVLYMSLYGLSKVWAVCTPIHMLLTCNQ